MKHLQIQPLSHFLSSLSSLLCRRNQYVFNFSIISLVFTSKRNLEANALARAHLRRLLHTRIHPLNLVLKRTPLMLQLPLRFASRLVSFQLEKFAKLP